MNITINNVEYTFDKTKLKYGKKKELEAKSYQDLNFVDGKAVITDMSKTIAVEYTIREEIAKICFGLPDDINLDDIEAELVESMFKCLIEAGLVKGEKKN